MRKEDETDLTYSFRGQGALGDEQSQYSALRSAVNLNAQGMQSQQVISRQLGLGKIEEMKKEPKN